MRERKRENIMRGKRRNSRMEKECDKRGNGYRRKMMKAETEKGKAAIWQSNNVTVNSSGETVAADSMS